MDETAAGTRLITVPIVTHTKLLGRNVHFVQQFMYTNSVESIFVREHAICIAFTWVIMQPKILMKVSWVMMN